MRICWSCTTDNPVRRVVVNIFVFDENKARLQLASNNNIRFFTSEGFSIQIKCSDTFRWLSPTVGGIPFVFPKTMRFSCEPYQGYKLRNDRNDNLWALVRGWQLPWASGELPCHPFVSVCAMRMTISRGMDTRQAKPITKLQAETSGPLKIRISRKGKRCAPY